MVTAIDIGLLLVILLSLFSGWRSGLLESVFSLAAWVGGILVAFQLSPRLYDRLPESLQRIPGAAVLAAVATFLVAFVIIRLLGMALNASSKAGPGSTDRFLGMLFGLLRGLFLAAAIGSMLVAFLPRGSRIPAASRVLPYLAPAGRIVGGIAPSGLRDNVIDGWDRLGAPTPRSGNDPVPA